MFIEAKLPSKFIRTNTAKYNKTGFGLWQVKLEELEELKEGGKAINRNAWLKEYKDANPN